MGLGLDHVLHQLGVVLIHDRPQVDLARVRVRVRVRGRVRVRDRVRVRVRVRVGIRAGARVRVPEMDRARRVRCHLGHEVEGVHPPVADVDTLELHGRRAAASRDLDDYVGVALLDQAHLVSVSVSVRVRARVALLDQPHRLAELVQAPG